jgi:uncharacterized membrane protein YkoI
MSDWRTYSLVGLIVLTIVALGCGEDNDDDDERAESVAQTAPGQPVPITEEAPGLTAKAKIQPEQARQIVMAKLPGGSITKGELEEEDGKLIYSFDIKVPGEEGITELHVDAMTGEVIKTEHEGKEESEAREAKEKNRK